jgi:hypothetical protein
LTVDDGHHVVLTHDDKILIVDRLTTTRSCNGRIFTVTPIYLNKKDLLPNLALGMHECQ